MRLEVRREVLPEARLDERDRGRGGNRDGAGGAPPRRYRHEFGFRTYDVGQLRALLAKVPELELVATYGFDYDVGAPVPLDGDRLDVVLVLRRSGADR